MMHQIEVLLRRHIGLEAATIGAALVERNVRLRMKQHGLTKTEAYHELLATSSQELQQLIEAVVVTETWFFRDREPFNVFAQLALPAWRERHPTGPLRVLSLPCASGEEPYSLAMALLDAGMAEPDFAIHAADISDNALAHAARAIYGNNSFRGPDLAFRDRHFLSTPEGYALSEIVRRCVKFERGNVIDDRFPTGSARYDFIFCRNLLIYFDRAAQMLTLGKMRQLLADDGVLFVGPAELPLALASGFVHADLPMAFACRKPVAAAAGATPSIHVPPGSAPEPSPPSTNDQALTAGRAQIEMEAARRHADSGRFAEATAICEEHLANNGPSAQAYFLLGLVKDARNDPEAAIPYYRKALYLEPKHYETLVHITLALEKSGAVDAARIYQRRAERAQPKP